MSSTIICIGHPPTFSFVGNPLDLPIFCSRVIEEMARYVCL